MKIESIDKKRTKIGLLLVHLQRNLAERDKPC